MKRVTFDEVDLLVIERWVEISEIVSAFEAVQDKIERQLQVVEEELRPWLAEQELELDADYKDGEFRAYQARWRPDPSSEPWATLAVGGFSPEDALGTDAIRLYSCVYCTAGKRRRLSKSAFGETLRSSLDPKQVNAWSEDTDRSCPVNRYAATTAKAVVIDSEKLTAFVREQFSTLVEFVDPVTKAISAGLKTGESRGER